MPTLKHIWRLASIKQSAGRAGPHAEKGAEEKNKKGLSGSTLRIAQLIDTTELAGGKGCPKVVG